jgi:sodium-dependent dicarboxylate transporter 2/3/5
VATPPNAIVFSSGVLTIPEMVRAGFLMNLIALVALTILATFAVPLVF